MVRHKKADLEKIEQGVKLILEGIGEDTQRPGIKKTPLRVAHMFAEILGGTHEEAAELLRPIKTFPFTPCVNIISCLLREWLMWLTFLKEGESWV